MSASMSRPEPVATGPEPVPVDDALALKAALGGVSSAFASLGRVFFCLDSAFHVLHASSQLDRMLGEGAARSAEGRPVADLLGTEMFGPEGTLRRVLLAGLDAWTDEVLFPVQSHGSDAGGGAAVQRGGRGGEVLRGSAASASAPAKKKRREGC